MSAFASRDLATEIGTMFQTDQSDRAVSFIDALIEGGDFSDIDRLRAANPGDGDHAMRNLLARRIDTAPLTGGGMAAVFVVTVYNRPGRYDPDTVARQIADAWGGGLLSLAVDRGYRGIDGLPRSPRDRLALSRRCAELGPEAAIAYLPRTRRKPKRAWDPNFVVCAAHADRDRDAYNVARNILLDAVPDAQVAEWAEQARRGWAGPCSDVGVPELLGSGMEIARKRSVLQNVAVFASWAEGGLVDVLRMTDGDLLVTSAAGGSRRIRGAGFLKDPQILEAALAAGSFPDVRRPVSILKSH